MASIPSKVAARLTAGVKRYQSLLLAAKTRDLGEADTVRIITDMLADVFGYDKFVEVTSEFAIRGTYCDLAIKLEGVIQSLVEVKAIGLDLKDSFVKQAVDYAANQGVDWVVLTTGIVWRIYKVTFAKPIDQELVVEFNFCDLNPKRAEDMELLYLFAKEGWVKSALGDFETQKQALSRFFLGQMIISEPVLDVIRRELRRISPDVKIEKEQIKGVLLAEVLKREVVEGDKADEARKKIARAANRALRAKTVRDEIPLPEIAKPPIISLE
jgi:predicted type IV restriction endonuclease